MKHHRIEALADGIFAIVMTLMVLDLKVPEIVGATNVDIWNALAAQGPIFLAYIYSFTLLFTYWRAHHYIVSVYASAVDVKVSSYNMFFFMAVGLIPFSSHLIGTYSDSLTAIYVYGLNIFAASVLLYLLRRYVLKHLRAEGITDEQVRYSALRTFVPMVFVVLACLGALIDTRIAIWVFTLAIFFNFINKPADIVYAWIEGRRQKKS
ncbi:MAG: hypothetical protein JWO00_466 [Candidatus Parcubacteria bacterium]|nr:hypothetical protein [Candidatus Parcubacteria bacterium]